jgi:hypothetical protein
MEALVEGERGVGGGRTVGAACEEEEHGCWSVGALVALWALWR